MIAKKLRGLGLNAIADDSEYDLQQGFLEEIAKDIVRGTFGWKNG
jgi:hypothetical protein